MTTWLGGRLSRWLYNSFKITDLYFKLPAETALISVGEKAYKLAVLMVAWMVPLTVVSTAVSKAVSKVAS